MEQHSPSPIWHGSWSRGFLRGSFCIFRGPCSNCKLCSLKFFWSETKISISTHQFLGGWVHKTRFFFVAVLTCCGFYTKGYNLIVQKTCSQRIFFSAEQMLIRRGVWSRTLVNALKGGREERVMTRDKRQSCFSARIFP